jgi:N-acyl-D-amino-acid deacylase
MRNFVFGHFRRVYRFVAADYDLVINGGRVMDPETMYDDIANVGIKDGRIAAITKNAITGKQTMDAKGLVVAPGFIDTHFHAVDPFATKMALRDGVTTGMDLELGGLHVKETGSSPRPSMRRL